METKICTKCNKEKEYESFSNKSKSKDGKTNICKTCHSKYRKLKYNQNRDKELAQSKKWAKMNPEKRKQHRKAGRTHKSTCKNCKKEIFICKGDKGKNKFCSRKCVSDYHRQDPVRYHFLNIKKGAGRRKKEFDLSEDYIKSIYNGFCAITNIPIKIYGASEKTNIVDAASLDRINSSLGYVEGNVQWVSLGVNYMKRDFSDEEVKKLLTTIINTNSVMVTR